MKTIPKDIIPCKFLHEWDENQAPLGSGYYWPEHFTECNYDDESYETGVFKEDLSNCNSSCSGYQPIKLGYCKKHDAQYLEFCDDCMKELEERELEDEKN